MFVRSFLDADLFDLFIVHCLHLTLSFAFCWDTDGSVHVETCGLEKVTVNFCILGQKKYVILNNFILIFGNI